MRTYTSIVAVLGSTWLLASSPAIAAEPSAEPSAEAPSEPSKARGYFALSGYFLGLTGTELRDVTAGGIERDIEADDGWGAGLAIGYRIGLGLRLEGEAVYRHNQVDIQRVFLSQPDVGGGVRSVGLMANAYFEPELRFPINPYIGAGIGGANVGLDANGLDIDEDDWVLAYQALAGAALKLGTVDFILGYRYFATDDPAFRGTEIEYRTHNLEVGLRINF
ncbi:MAG TPA: outer membrane beta-barrel protein [Thermodesulfobacteriota bacterium]